MLERQNDSMLYGNMGEIGNFSIHVWKKAE
jgi:hypothetical protein